MNKTKIRIIRVFVTLIFCAVSYGIGVYQQSKKNEVVYAQMCQTVTSIDDPRLIDAIIFVESSNNPRARSSKGCIGLMQVNWRVWKKELRKLGIHSADELYDPMKNVKAGKYILNRHYEWAKGDLRKALQDYSNGKSFFYEKVMYHAITGEK